MHLLFIIIIYGLYIVNPNMSRQLDRWLYYGLLYTFALTFAVLAMHRSKNASPVGLIFKADPCLAAIIIGVIVATFMHPHDFALRPATLILLGLSALLLTLSMHQFEQLFIGFSMLTFFINLPVLLSGYGRSYADQDRFKGLFYHPNICSSMFCIVLAVALLSPRFALMHRWLLALGSLFVIMQTHSRSGIFIAFATLISLGWYFKGYRNWRLNALALGIIALMLGSFWYWFDNIFTFLLRDESIEHFVTFNSRLYVWQSILKVLDHNFWFGVGQQYWKVFVTWLNWDDLRRIWPVQHAHNMILSTAMRFGVPVAVLALIWIIQLNVRLLRRLSLGSLRESPYYRTELLIYIIFCQVVLASTMSSTSFQVTSTMDFMLLLSGVACSVVALQQRSGSSNDSSPTLFVESKESP